jgi:replication fork clamp-binding protein CrfC
MTQTNDPRKVTVIVELIDHTSKIAEAQDRGDLVERMANAKARISDPQIRVVIAGQLKQGKSQLLNSLLNVPVSRVGDDETTVLATMVSYGEQAAAKLIVAGADGGEPSAIEIPIADIKNDLRRHPAAGGRQVLRVAVTANSPLLKGGLVFVDTPGVGGHGQPHLSATLGLLPDADAMLMISDTSQEFTEPEMTFIRQGVRNLSRRNDCRDQDGPVPALAGDRRGQQGASAARRARDTDDSSVVAAAQPRHPAQRQGTQRGVELSCHCEVPQRKGAVGGE